MSIVAAALAALMVGPGSCRIPSRKKTAPQSDVKPADVVVIQLTGPVSEMGSEGDPFTRKSVALRRLLRTFRKARQSKKVAKVVLRIGSLGVGWAQLEDLRQAVLLTRKAGKKVVAHLDDAGNREYYLASAADEIAMSPAAGLWLVGMSARVLFIKGLLTKIGVEPEFLHVGKYKGAADSLMRDKMSPAMKEALGALLDNSYAKLVSAVAKGRKLTEARVKQLIDQAPHMAATLVGLKLIDRVGEHAAETRKLAGSGSINWEFGTKKKKKGTLSSLIEMLRPSVKKAPPKSPHVALVYAVGNIVYGPARKGLGVSPHVASHELVKQLDKLRKNKRVRAVVLRIDSPGGSALASDLIWHAVKRLRAVKPVVISMGNVAASGGYYIATAGTRIYAQPMTLTGSIGVIGGKFSLSGLMQKVGVTSEVITRGARADMFNFTRRWTDDERKTVQLYMERIYRQFVQRVANGRKMSATQVETVAQGRIWSGADAKRHKLVDTLGGLVDAVADAKQLAKLPKTAKTAVYPRPKTWIEKLQEGLGGSARLRLIGDLLANIAPREARALLQLVDSIGAWRRDRALTWLPYLIQID